MDTAYHPAEDDTERMADAKLALEQLRMALRNMRPNYWNTPVFAGVVCLMFAHWIALPRLALWFGLTFVAQFPLIWTAHSFARLKPPPEEGRKWVIRCAIGMFVAAAAWSSFALIFWVPGNDTNHMLMMMLIACTLAGTVVLLGASRPLALACFAAYGPTLVAIPLGERGVVNDGLFLLSLLFCGYIVHLANQTHTAAADLLKLRDDKNELIEALAISKAASDRALEHAEAASRSKSEFLANMSHELRTPLNAILGFSEMIQSGAFADKLDKHIEYAGIIHESGYHLLALINDILDLAKLEAGAMSLRETNVDLAALILDCAKLMGAKALSGGIKIKQNVPPNLPLLYADERAMKQVLLNLLSNAVKFTPANGTVSVFAHMEKDGALTFGVRDTGLGIAEDDLPLVFQSFGQGRHDVVTADKGTGLGLPIVKGLIEAHNGTVTLESKVAVGTCVTVRLPASRTCERPDSLEAVVA